MELLQTLLSQREWQRFLEYKRSGGHLSKQEEAELKAFVAEKRYLHVAQKLNSGGQFSLPERVFLNKRFSEKKREVFLFPQQENLVQKMLAFELLSYDYLFAPNLYSFRAGQGVKKAVTGLVNSPGIQGKFAYKLDISDYFCSVDAGLLLPRLREIFIADPAFFAVLEAMLVTPLALEGGKAVRARKGILAGCPLSGFLANVFIAELDRHFAEEGVLYARYADDIIVFADSEEEINAHRQYIADFLREKHLHINTNKECLSRPGEGWVFLGFLYRNGVVDIAPASKEKLKKKMKRKARALVRWKRKSGASPQRAARAYIRYFNNKLYHNARQNELTWARWYFPLINTSESLKELDAYEQQCIRFVATESYTNKRFLFSYEQMKALGYVPLVSEYYKNDKFFWAKNRR